MKPTITDSRNPFRGAQFALRVSIAVVVAVLGFGGLANTCRAGAQFLWQNPVPTANSLKGVYFVNANKGWAVGEFGEILKTTDGGTIWSFQRIGADNMGQRRQLTQFNRVYFVDENTGWAVGGVSDFAPEDGDLILKTTNGGATWNSQRSGRGNIVSIQFVNQNIGWALDLGQRTATTLLKTTDGGTSWASQHIFDGAVLSASFISQDLGWIVGGDGTIERTDDGGTTWLPQVGIDGYNLTSVQFLDQFKGWVLAIDAAGGPNQNSRIMKTEDGGATWISQYVETTLGLLNSVEFVNPEVGCVVGGGADSAIILNTTDGGTTWARKTFTFSQQNYFKDVSFADPLNGWTVGYNGAIFHTTNGGTTWNAESRGTRGNLRGIQMVNESIGWVIGGEMPIDDTTGWVVEAETPDGIQPSAGWGIEGANFDGIILKTSNAGQTWTPQLRRPSSFTSVSFVNATTGWVVGNFGGIEHTEDGGTTWNPQTSGTNTYLQSVYFRNSSSGGEGWAVGGSGTIIHTTNGGTNWNPQDSTVPWALNSVHFPVVSLPIGWVVGNGSGNTGTILKTTNGGTNWDLQYSAPVPLRSVYFIDETTGWAVGGDSNGWILNTTDGGATWSFQLFVIFHVFTSVQFTDRYAGWAVGDYGYIFETTDGGAHWTRQTTVFPDRYNGVYFTNHHTGWVVGAHGAILRTGCPSCSTLDVDNLDEDALGPFLTALWPAWPGE